jgi:hypothetical protein
LELLSRLSGGGTQWRLQTELCMYEKLPFHFDIFNKTHVLAFGDVDKHTNERRTCFGQ